MRHTRPRRGSFRVMQHLDTLLIVLPLALLLAIAREWDAFMAQDAADYAAFRARIAVIRRAAYAKHIAGAGASPVPTASPLAE